MSNANNFYTVADVSAQRVWDERAPWLMTIYVPQICKWIKQMRVCVQARCVVDDFGNLVAVESFC